MKTLFRRVILGTAAMVIMLAVCDKAAAANWVVTSTADSGPGSLRATIVAAAAGDNITFGVTGLIIIDASIGSGSSAIWNGLLIDKDLTIQGPGADQLTITGDSADGQGVFHIAPVASAVIRGLKIIGAEVDTPGCGGINNRGTLALIDCSISGGSTFGPGTGICNSGHLYAHGCAITNNSSYNAHGVGILSSGYALLTNCTVAGNHGHSGCGGGIFNSGYLEIMNSTVNGNALVGPQILQGGGGICNSGTAVLRNSTVSGNILDSPHNFPSNGGGIRNDGIMTLISATIVSNTVYSDDCGRGGGIWNAPTATLNSLSSIIAGNMACLGPDIFGTLTSYGFNLIQNSAGATISGDLTGNILGSNPLLGALQNNGGPTLTHLPRSGSPVLDKGKNSGTRVDQRGRRRIIDLIGVPNAFDATDIGSVEYDVGCPSVPRNLRIIFGGLTSVRLAWDPNPEPDILGYNLYFGNSPNVFTNVIFIGNQTTQQVNNLALGTTYYFTITALGPQCQSEPCPYVIYSTAARPTLAIPAPISGGKLRIELSPMSPWQAGLESSGNLRDWSPVTPTTTLPDGTLRYDISVVPGSSTFFREKVSD